MKRLFSIVILLITLPGFAQNFDSQDRKAMKRMQASVNYLSDDKLEGRRTGSDGERIAYTYIIEQFRSIGLQPKGSDGFLQPFEVNEGKFAEKSTAFYIDEVRLENGRDFTILPFTGTTTATNGLLTTLSLSDSGKAWVINLKDTLAGAKHNPHFDLTDYLHQTALNAQKAGATAVVYFNSGATKTRPDYNPKDKTNALNIPVLFLYDPAFADKVSLATGDQPVKFVVDVKERISVGHNVAGFIDNKAKNTIVIGAHYDHLGYGKDGNSRYLGDSLLIHNGADDNASGVSAMLELARWLSKSTLRSNNYLFLAFSGEELGLYGSKYYVKNATIPISSMNFMINLDMVGRMNPDLKGVTIGGYGTSPYWGTVISTKDPYMSIKLDSSGAGPSDHTSFYRADIPVLFFFTGTHDDYHKPSDDAYKINIEGTMSIIKYIKNLLIGVNYEPKLAFTKTREQDMGKSTFKVSLGIMPDYTYSGQGILVEGVSPNKAAQKAGIVKGDILIQLGSFQFTEIQSYMSALNKFEKGETTTVKVKRGDQVLEFPITF